jgi:hypothetical protein
MAQIEQAVKDSGISFAQLIQTVLVLCGNGTFTAVQDDTAITKAKKHTDKLNTHLMLKARSSNDITFLASPVTGGGVMLGVSINCLCWPCSRARKSPKTGLRLWRKSWPLKGKRLSKKASL